MNHFTTEQGHLFYCYTLNVKQTARIDQFLSLLDESGISGIIAEAASEAENGRPAFNPFRMFACILYGFAFGSPTLRNLEDSCTYDLRFMSIMEGAFPSASTFSRFINKVILPHADELFALVTKAILSRFGLSLDDCYIDGTKIEADANRYKFVWKPTTRHLKLSDKIRNLLSVMVLERGIPKDGIIPAKMIAAKLTDARTILAGMPEEDVGGRKVWEGMIGSLEGYLAKALEYEEMEEICGPDRNSYYKTDHDATAMCLKNDYYSGLGSRMHAAYEIQFIVASGLIASYYVSQDRTDIYTFIPAFDVFHRLYDVYPKRVVADAGYGCLRNYRYCNEHGMRAFIKYQSWEGECSGRRPALYEIDEQGNLFCLGGRIGTEREIPGRHHRIEDAVFYVVEGCTGCAFTTYCRRYMNDKDGDSRIFEVCPELQLFKQKARDLLLSVEGIELRVNRSCQAEGSFGAIKYNMGFDRFRRTGIESVTAELMLTALGFNLRKFFRYCDKGWSGKVWKAPEGTQPEKFKKPSAKRCENRVLKQRKRSPNERVKVSHKYKKLPKK